MPLDPNPPRITGVDFETLAVPVVIDFHPDVQRTLLPVNITEDDILEQMEHFF